MTILTRKQIEAIANHHRHDVDLGRWDGDELDLMDTARAYHDLRDDVLAQVDRANAVWDGFIPTGNLRYVVARVERGE